MKSVIVCVRFYNHVSLRTESKVEDSFILGL